MSCTTTCRKANGRQAHCAACHRTFSAISSFDHHRIGHVDARQCADPETRGMHLNAHGVWCREGGASFWDSDSAHTIKDQDGEQGAVVPQPTLATSEAAETISGGRA